MNVMGVTNHRRAILRFLTASALAFGVTHGAGAADYPDRAVTVIVPMGPGGPTDLLARIVAQRANQQLGQPFVIENRPGAAGNIGIVAAARSRPDGYTFLSASDTIGINPILYPNRKANYELRKDFMPVTDLISTPVGIYVRQDSPIKSLDDLIARGKAKNSTLNYGSPGAGTPPYIAMEVFKARTGIDMVHVPFQGSTPMIQALLGGNLEAGIVGISGVYPLIVSGQLRPLVIMDDHRRTDMPDVPVITEFNIDVPKTFWYANQSLYAPANTPRPIVEKIATISREAMLEPQNKKRWEEGGSAISTDGPDALSRRLQRDIVVWENLLTSLNLKIQ
jgi:tripartite-type tricarboxylate transporter receptor subunit TctC